MATASANAISHGLTTARPIVPGESVEEWQTYINGVIVHWKPDGTMEVALVERLALLLWRLRRVVAYETAITSVGLDEAAVIPKYDADDEAEDSRNRRTVVNEASRVYRAEQNLDKIRERQQGMIAENCVLQLLDGQPDELGLQGRLIGKMFAVLNRLLQQSNPGATFDFATTSFFRGLGVPDEHCKKPYSWPGWTVGLMRMAVDQVVTLYKTTLKDLLDTSANLRADEIREAEAKVAELRERVATSVSRRVMRAMLPNKELLDKIQRYEAHLGRQLQQTLNSLERLQAARAGLDVPPPAAATVTIDDGK
ncbi:MAG: hypothetical protein KF873_03085 [Gemmataceae bacterium]|nr:hypothetical protein [Gemmataceae bacterium]